MAKNDYLVVKIGIDTAENGPSKVGESLYYECPSVAIRPGRQGRKVPASPLAVSTSGPWNFKRLVLGCIDADLWQPKHVFFCVFRDLVLIYMISDFFIAQNTNFRQNLLKFLWTFRNNSNILWTYLQIWRICQILRIFQQTDSHSFTFEVKE